MLVRVKFSKLGTLKFIGHLDVMRYFQKVLSRSGLPVKYSQGFHPHQILSFASPLGVGLTSDGEYLDFETEEELSKEIVFNALAQAVTEGFSISEVTILEPRVLNVKKMSAMALVDSADYLIYLKGDDTAACEKTAFEKAMKAWMEQEEIVITKKTKTSEKEMDIKPYIYHYAFAFDEFLTGHKLKDEYKAAVRCSITPGNSIGCYLHLSAGSAMNLKPETILEDILSHGMFSWKVEDFALHRLEMYHADEKGNWIPLWDIR